MAYFLGNPDKPLHEFTWEMGEDQLQAKVTDGERFFAAVLRPGGKLVWRQAKLPPGTKTNGIQFEKVPSDFQSLRRTTMWRSGLAALRGGTVSHRGFACPPLLCTTRDSPSVSGAD